MNQNPYRCRDRFCGQLDCINCHPENFDARGVYRSEAYVFEETYQEALEKGGQYLITPHELVPIPDGKPFSIEEVCELLGAQTWRTLHKTDGYVVVFTTNSSEANELASSYLEDFFDHVEPLPVGVNWGNPRVGGNILVLYQDHLDVAKMLHESKRSAVITKEFEVTQDLSFYETEVNELFKHFGSSGTLTSTLPDGRVTIEGWTGEFRNHIAEEFLTLAEGIKTGPFYGPLVVCTK